MANKPFPSLNRQEAIYVVKKIKEILGPEVVAMVSASGLDPNRFIRFLYIASLCRNRREEKGLSLKDASQQLKVPQYRLKAIEGGTLWEITPESLDAYIRFLGLMDEFARWRQANQDVCDEIGLAPK